MVTVRCKVHGEFLRGRNAPKTNSTIFLKKSGLLTLKKEYQPSSFMYLKDSVHVDPDNLLPYITKRVYVRNGRIVCDRELYNAGDAQPKAKKRKLETIHAMDIVLFTLISNPMFKSPLIVSGESLTAFIASLETDSTLVTAPAQPRGVKRARLESIQTDKATLDRIVSSQLRDSPTNFDFSAKRRRSDRLKVLSTKVYVIRDRKDVDNLENIYAEDISIPNTHPQAMKSAFSILWARAEKSETDGLKKKDTYEIVDEISLPPGTKIIPGKWVYAIKVDSNGKVVRFKARLTARGDLVDAEELDFQDVFSPVVGWQGLRIFFSPHSSVRPETPASRRRSSIFIRKSRRTCVSATTGWSRLSTRKNLEIKKVSLWSSPEREKLEQAHNLNFHVR